MATLKVGNKYVELCGANDDVIALVDRATSARNPQARFSAAYKRGFMDDRFHLLKKDFFPTGLLYNVVEMLQKEEIEWELEMNCNVLPIPDDKVMWPDRIELRDYQEEAVYAALKYSRGLVNVPTNGGKSFIGMAICGAYTYYYEDLRVLFLVKRAEGVKQMVAHFEDYFGYQYAGYEPTDNTRVTVMTYAKAARRDLSEYSVVICDEVQVVGAKTIFKTAMEATNAYHMYGLSGTPLDREDGKNVYVKGATGEVIFDGMDHETLIEDGFSAETDIVMLRVAGNTVMGNDWHTVETEGISNNDKRNEKVAEVAHAAFLREMKTLIMVRRLNHGTNIQDILRSKYGMEVGFTHGKQSAFKRTQVLDDYLAEESGILIASGIWDDSISIPDIQVMVNAAGLKSKIATKQKLGRGLRNPDGKKKLIMVDFMDGHSYILRRHSKRRKENYEEEGFEVREVDTVEEIFDGADGSDAD